MFNFLVPRICCYCKHCIVCSYLQTTFTEKVTGEEGLKNLLLYFLFVFLSNYWEGRPYGVIAGVLAYGLEVIIYKAFCSNIAQGCIKGAPKEARTHFWRFATLDCKELPPPPEVPIQPRSKWVRIPGKPLHSLSELYSWERDKTFPRG